MKLTTPCFARSVLVSTMTLAGLGGSVAVAGNVKPLPENVTFTEHVAPILFQIS